MERLIGSIRRDLLDHVVVMNEKHLRSLLKRYFGYCNGSRTHLSLEMDCPISRPEQESEVGEVVEIPQVGGLHHRYERRAA